MICFIHLSRVYSLFAGIRQLFDHLISAIIVRKDIIERENELNKRESVILDSVITRSWPNASGELDKPQASGSWNCC
jgi:hypothetical protein